MENAPSSETFKKLEWRLLTKSNTHLPLVCSNQCCAVICSCKELLVPVL
jgi:hypothetical protein